MLWPICPKHHKPCTDSSFVCWLSILNFTCLALMVCGYVYDLSVPNFTNFTDGSWVCLWSIYPALYMHNMPSTTGSLVIIIKLEAKDVHMPTMFVVYFLKTYSITEYCISCNAVLQRVTGALVFLPLHKFNTPALLLLIVGNLKYAILFITCSMRIGQVAQKLKGGTYNIHADSMAVL